MEMIRYGDDMEMIRYGVDMEMIKWLMGSVVGNIVGSV